MPKGLTALLVATIGICASTAAPITLPPAHSAALTQNPLVMRLDKDEFRIVFGIGAHGCLSQGCSGVIRYRIEWQTEEGAVVTELKRVAYNVAPRAARTITVDRQYLDTAEGAHTTQVVRVTVERITCSLGAGPQAGQLAAR